MHQHFPLSARAAFAMRTLALAAGLSALAAGAGAADAPAIVGEATLVIGNARIVSADGEAVGPVNRGTPVRVGDKVETEAGGHVHLRFVDGGRVSVRPSSRLQIENYSHSAQQPALSAIKFRLDEGVVRSITGSWGEAARDRFRLNTPVAAIGVKGTDFVVKADSLATSATVYTGAITLAPLSGGCSSLGPCINGSEKFLSADMKGQMLQLTGQQATAQVVPMLVDSQVRRLATADAAKLDKTAATEVAAADKTANYDVAVQHFLARNVLASPRPGSPAVADPTLPASTAIRQQLVWASPDGRSVVSYGAVEETLTLFQQAKRAGYETLVESTRTGYFALFRDTNGPGLTADVLAQSTGVVNFGMTNYQAVYERQGTNGATVTENATIGNDARLSVDFSQAKFDTKLTVSAPSLSAVTVQDSGTINPQTGIFAGSSSGEVVKGALSVDRRAAAYEFRKNFDANSGIGGITTWGR